MLTAVFAMLVIATPPIDSPALHEKKRAYLQAQLDAAREREAETRVEGAALVGASVAIPFVAIAGGAAAVGTGAAIGQEEAGVAAAMFIMGSGAITMCVLSPYALLTGLTRWSEVEDVEREVVAREQLLVAHESRPLRF